MLILYQELKYLLLKRKDIHYNINIEAVILHNSKLYAINGHKSLIFNVKMQRSPILSHNFTESYLQICTCDFKIF